MAGLSMKRAALAALDRISLPSPDKANSPLILASRAKALRFFLVCAALFVAIEVFLTLGPALSRHVPVEIDDSLTYLLRGAQMVECPRQDCPAMQDLRKELLALLPDTRIAGAVQEAYLHVFLNHVPGYSIAIAALHKAGLSYINAYHAMTVLGGIALAAGASVFAYAVAGPVAGGLAILLFGTTYFVGHGLVWIVPSNMTLGFTLLGLGIVSLRRERQQRERQQLTLLILIALILSWHSIGKFYACAIVAAYALLAQRPYSRRDWIFLAAGASMIAGWEALTHVVEHPMLKMPLVPLPYEGTALEAIRGNLMEIPRVVGRSAFMTLGYAGLAMAAIMAAMVMPKERRAPYLVFLAGFGALCLLSVFHLSPRIPAEIFARFWVPMALVLACGAASVLVSSFSIAPRLVAELASAMRKAEPLDAGTIWRSVPALLLAATICVGALAHVAIGAAAVVRAERMVTARHDYTYLAGSARLLREPDGSCGPIFYARKEVMYAHFLDGSMNCRVYLNVSGEKDLRDPAFAAMKRVAFYNPVRERKGWVDLDRGWKVEATFEAAPPSPINLFLRGRGEVELGIADADGKLVSRATVRADGEGSWTSYAIPRWQQGDTLKLTTTSGRVELGGLRLHAPAAGTLVFWPWGEGVRMRFQPVVPYQERPLSDIAFDAAAWAAVTGRKLRVIDDRGFAVLATLD